MSVFTGKAGFGDKWANPHLPWGRGYGAAPYVGFLDGISDAAAYAYSLTRLTVSYTGAAVRVQAWDTIAVASIGVADVLFKADGSIGLDSLIDNCDATAIAEGMINGVSTLADLCQGYDGYVATWYDQVGGKNLLQATIAKMPALVIAGALQAINAQAAINADGTDDWMSTAAFASAMDQPFSAFALATIASDNAGSRSILGGLASSRNIFTHRYIVGDADDRYFVTHGTASSINPPTDTLPAAGSVISHIMLAKATPLTDILLCNGVSKIDEDCGDGSYTGLSTFSRYDGTAGFSDSKVSDIIAWTGTISAGTITAITAYVAKYGI